MHVHYTRWAKVTRWYLAIWAAVLAICAVKWGV